MTLYSRQSIPFDVAHPFARATDRLLQGQAARTESARDHALAGCGRPGRVSPDMKNMLQSLLLTSIAQSSEQAAQRLLQQNFLLTQRIEITWPSPAPHTKRNHAAALDAWWMPAVAQQHHPSRERAGRLQIHKFPQRYSTASDKLADNALRKHQPAGYHHLWSKLPNRFCILVAIWRIHT